MDHRNNHHHHHHHIHHTPTSGLVTTTMLPRKSLTTMSASGMDQDSHHHHHAMTFQLWTNSEFLLESWTIGHVTGLTAAIAFSAFLAVVYEGSKFYYHLGKILRSGKPRSKWRETAVAHYVSRMWKSLAYMIHFFIGYALMLCTMTFNLWVLLAVCLGAGIGHLFMFPVIRHVLQRNADHVVRELRKPCETLLSRTEQLESSDASQTEVQIEEKEDSEEDSQGSVSDILLCQISNMRQPGTRSTTNQQKQLGREYICHETVM